MVYTYKVNEYYYNVGGDVGTGTLTSIYFKYYDKCYFLICWHWKFDVPVASRYLYIHFDAAFYYNLTFSTRTVFQESKNSFLQYKYVHHVRFRRHNTFCAVYTSLSGGVKSRKLYIYIISRCLSCDNSNNNSRVREKILFVYFPFFFSSTENCRDPSVPLLGLRRIISLLRSRTRTTDERKKTFLHIIRALLSCICIDVCVCTTTYVYVRDTTLPEYSRIKRFGPSRRRASITHTCTRKNNNDSAQH